MALCTINCLLLFLSFSAAAHHRSTLAARLLDHDPPSRTGTGTGPADHQQISFFMQDVLHPPSTQLEGTNPQLPSPNPAGLFPPKDPTPRPTPATSSHPWLPFMTSFQVSEIGAVTVIDEGLRDGYLTGSPVVGKVKGVRVTSSDGRNGVDGQMIAMTAIFDKGESGDSLRFFGLHRPWASESHIAIIGGTGKYDDANGYATVRTVAGGDGERGGEGSSDQSLLVTVYLK